MEVVIAIVAGIFGSVAAVLGFVQFLISRHDRKIDNVCQYKAQLDRIEAKSDRNELAVCRLQLIYLIHEQPQNVDTILQTAQRYFVELNGNGEAWAIFEAWAEENHLDTGWYKALLERKEKHNA
jgi:hypothetical protein